MPRRHRFQHVQWHGPSRPSARALDRALIAAGYVGPAIQFGVGGNKRVQLERMRAAGVPCPRAIPLHDHVHGLVQPAVARTDTHRAGSGFWLCRTGNEMTQARNAGATHAMEFIENAREFRVHVAFGKSIKLTEKQDTSRGRMGNIVRSHANGWHQLAPQPNAHKVSLRRHAKAAVEALGFDFGAVDILMRNYTLQGGEPHLHAPEFYVLEVNTAPALTDATSDTLSRYVQAFINHARERQQ